MCGHFRGLLICCWVIRCRESWNREFIKIKWNICLTEWKIEQPCHHRGLNHNQRRQRRRRITLSRQGCNIYPNVSNLWNFRNFLVFLLISDDNYNFCTVQITSLTAMSPENTKKWPKSDKEHSGKILTYCDEVKRNYQLTRHIFTYSEVFKARDKNNNKFVAMKRVLMENEKEGVSSEIPWMFHEHWL